MKSIKKILCLGLVFFAGCYMVGFAQNETFKPSFHAGVLMHTYVGMQQKGFDDFGADKADDWSATAALQRGRIITETHLTPRDYVFFQTELTTIIGTNGIAKPAVMKVIDAQYDHKFADYLTVSGGKVLVSHNRNGLQTAHTLMINDFTYFQYPYNTSEESPLQNDLGRDIGVNLSGGFLGNKLKYRVGAFVGKRAYFSDNAPRFVGRVEYNFFDVDKYSGTNLGEGKTFTLAGGVDTQGDYAAGGVDMFADCPLGSGSVTFNGAYSYITGGNDPAAKHSFASEIPTQNVFLAELGYYIKSLKLQPWLRFEKQDVVSQDKQRDGMAATEFDKLNSNDVFGGGISYFFNGYGTNLKLSYVSWQKDVATDAGIKSKSFGQVWLQLQLCYF
ncbi:MAG: hypothetical protein LBF08_03865 [Dysgonamonadaceae bacterium]|jgi:hypothetical protein|nr:hypothetical protein [Dysgonamonadaceae bacterium]